MLPTVKALALSIWLPARLPASTPLLAKATLLDRVTLLLEAVGLARTALLWAALALAPGLPVIQTAYWTASAYKCPAKVCK